MQAGGTIARSFRGRARRDAVAFYLTQLARAVLAGEVTVVSGDRVTTLATSESLDLEMKDGTGRIAVRLTWKGPATRRSAPA